MLKIKIWLRSFVIFFKEKERQERNALFYILNKILYLLFTEHIKS